ncbi:hypothetical protein E6A44_004555 [Pedobacter ureilyticus]|uniref:Uncharacterized protein n=2 Tax=Pedobacter ureilyticus TaxID=1393051 RepID=A0ABW9J2S7_9SPHI
MDAEIEPSADLWGNISQQLEPKKKRSFPILWVAAASVVVVASVLLFTQGGDKVYLQGAATEVATVNVPEATQVVPVVATEETTVNEVVLSDAAVSNRRLVRTAVSKIKTATIEDVQEKSFVTVQPSEKNEHLVIKRGEVKPLDVTPTVSNTIENQAMHAQADTKPVDYFEQADESDNNKKGIRNVGDLINYVVDKVDKRDKKIIKFDTDDDDNSSIIGLNIGFLKLNKKNNK